MLFNKLAKTVALVTCLTVSLSVTLMGVEFANAGASRAQCQIWSNNSDRDMGACRNSYLSGKMTEKRSRTCCQHRQVTIKTWQQCTQYFGEVDWRSLRQSKREWGC